MRYTLMLMALLAAFSTSTVKAQIAADLLVAQGDALGDSTVSSLNAPFVNGLGQVGFNAQLANESSSIVFDGAEVFNSAGVTPAFRSIDGPMGFGNAGQFIFRPIIEDDTLTGIDAVWNQDGPLIAEGTQSPGFELGVIVTSLTTPMFTDDGTAYWNGGINDGGDNVTTAGRVIYRRNTDGSIDVVLSSGGVVDGETVGAGSSSIGFNYQFSRNNENSIFEFNAERSDTITATNDGRVLVNSEIVAAEASPAADGSANPPGDDWDNFDRFTINNSGNYVFSGDTFGASTSRDEFIAYNGVIQLREGDAISQGTISGGVDAVTLNNSNALTFIWDLDLNDGSGPSETLFFAGDASDLSDLLVVASVGDELDLDGDGVAERLIENFTAVFSFGAELALTEDGVIYAQVLLTDLDGTAETDAIVAFSTGGSILLGDVNLDGSVDFSDIAAFIGVLAANGDQAEADIDGNGVVNFSDIAPFINILSK